MTGIETTKTLVNTRVCFFDGLRGWAACAVAAGHTISVLPKLTSLQYTLARPFFDGPFAVVIFFVLSGIVLSIDYFRYEKTEIISAMMIKRIPRLAIPILVSSLIIVLLMKLGVFIAVQSSRITGDNVLSGHYNFIDGNFIGAVLFSVRDVFFNFQPASAYNPPLWTMQWELSGSYLVAAVLLLYRYAKPKKLIWVFISAYVYFVNPIFVPFMMGILMSSIYVRHNDFIEKMKRKKAVRAGIFIGVLCFYFAGSWFGRLAAWYLYWPLISPSASLLILLIMNTEVLQKLLSTKISRFMGKISFPLYLVHYPVISLFTTYLIAQYGLDSTPIQVLFFVLTMLVSLAASCVFYPVEKWSITVSRKIAEYVLKDRKP